MHNKRKQVQENRFTTTAVNGCSLYHTGRETGGKGVVVLLHASILRRRTLGTEQPCVLQRAV